MWWVIGGIAWLASGFLAWRIQVGRIGASFLSPLDSIMIGPCMLMGPIALILVWIWQR